MRIRTAKTVLCMLLAGTLAVGEAGSAFAAKTAQKESTEKVSGQTVRKL